MILLLTHDASFLSRPLSGKFIFFSGSIFYIFKYLSYLVEVFFIRVNFIFYLLGFFFLKIRCMKLTKMNTMTLNNFEENSSVETRTEVPATNQPVSIYQPTSYDYLALLPALITAVTPLILVLKKK